IIALFIVALGTSLTIRSDFGSSPISAPPYVLSSAPGGSLSLGTVTILMHIVFILIQWILLKRDFNKIQFLQVFAGIFFGLFIDVTMWLTSPLQTYNSCGGLLSYILRFAELFVGGAVMAYGIGMEVKCNVIMLAGEGLQYAISKVSKQDFGKIKIIVDTSLVCISVLLSFIIFHKWRWDMIGIGTLISMFYVGFAVKKIENKFGFLEKLSE
ncbi:MAG: cytidylate kinase family protein, partial [Bacteroidales bacterium]|nr:cytidylate kinase family protein [Bacteroidales bacterium]